MGTGSVILKNSLYRNPKQDYDPSRLRFRYLQALAGWALTPEDGYYHFVKMRTQKIPIVFVSKDISPFVNQSNPVQHIREPVSDLESRIIIAVREAQPIRAVEAE